MREHWRPAALALLALALLALALLAGCADEQAPAPTSPTSADRERVARCVRQPPYRPGPEEEQPEIKRIAGRIAQRATTYGPGTAPERIAASLPSPTGGRREVARTLAPLVRSGVHSCGKVAYPQLSGLTGTTAGVMVAVEQMLKERDGRTRSHVRVLDVRLRRAGRAWRLERIASAGGTPVPRPRSLGPMATRVLDHPAITLTDSARWDIHQGHIDDALLGAIARVADRRALSVLVLRSGHPRYVWATDRPSAHATGRAADIWAVQGRAVIRQRHADSPAHAVASALLGGGATQVGSPWALGARSFTDPVHQDHLHLQQR